MKKQARDDVLLPPGTVSGADSVSCASCSFRLPKTPSHYSGGFMSRQTRFHILFSWRLFIIGLVVISVSLWFLLPPARLSLVAVLLLFLPGFLIERTVRPVLDGGCLSRPVLWLGLSLAIVPLIYQWSSVAGRPLRLPILAAIATAGCCAGLVLAWRQSASLVWPGRRNAGWLLAFLLLFSIATGIRFNEIRGLALPPWVDSVHHTLLVQVAGDRGLAPTSLQPFLPVEDLPYHWGYHVWTATVAQLAGAAPVDALLWSGQLLNALHVFTAAALALYFWRHPLAGLAAGIVVGMLSIYPAYYLSWGRYTQLMGLLLIPPLMLAWHALLRRPDWRQAAIVTLLCAGLSLIHFRVLLFGLAYMAAALLVSSLNASRQENQRRILAGATAGLAAIGVTLPWLWLLLQQRLAPALSEPDGLSGGGNYNALNTALVWAGENRLLAALAMLAACWLLGQRSRQAVTLIIWVAAMILMANPWLLSYVLPAGGAMLLLWAASRRHWPTALAGGLLLLANPWFLQLPFFWLITNEVVIISLFLPFSLLIGGAYGGLARRLTAHDESRPAAANTGSRRFALQPAQWYTILNIFLVLGAGWGYWRIHNLVLQENLVLATAADREAIEWIAENTRREARFLTNAQPWLAAADMGSDAGWWILPLTGRQVSTPPVVFTYGPADYQQLVRATTGTVINYQPGTEQAIYDLIVRRGITHIYLGSRGGPLSAELFADRTRFELIYEQEEVRIYRVR